MVRYLAPNGVARFVLANGSRMSSQSGKVEIQTSLIEADMVNCMRELPGHLLRPTQIPRLPVDASGVERSCPLTRESRSDGESSVPRTDRLGFSCGEDGREWLHCCARILQVRQLEDVR